MAPRPKDEVVLNWSRRHTAQDGGGFCARDAGERDGRRGCLKSSLHIFPTRCLVFPASHFRAGLSYISHFPYVVSHDGLQRGLALCDYVVMCSVTVLHRSLI